MARITSYSGHRTRVATDVNEKRQAEKKLAGPLSLGDAVVLLKLDCNFSNLDGAPVGIY